MTVNELAADYIEHLRARIGDTDERRRRSPRTVQHYEQQLRLHVLPVLGRQLASDVSVVDVRRLLNTLAAKRLAPRGRTGAAKRLSPRSRNGLLGILSSCLAHGVKRGVVARSVVRDLDRDDRPGAGRLTEPRYLSTDELAAVLSEMGGTFRPIAAVCAYAGLRLSEALGLRWQDLDLKAGTLTVTAQLGADGERMPLKTAASAATVPVLPVLAAELRTHGSRVAEEALTRVRPEALIFTTARGKPHGRRNVLRAVYAAGDAAGLNGNGRERVGVHDLRHPRRARDRRGLDAAGGRGSGPPREPAGDRDRLRGADGGEPRAARRQACAGVRSRERSP